MTNLRVTVAVQRLRTAPDTGLSVAGSVTERAALVETLTAEA